MRARRLLIALACATFSLTLAACGDTTNNRFGDNEGIYVDVGHLKYQVELSRQLNPYDVEDRNYVAGVSPKLSYLAPADQWFGVFMLVENKTGKPQQAASDYYITDTEDDVYRPVPIAATNPFAYTPILIGAHANLPLPGSVAYDGPTGGEVLLFKIPYATDDNRPWDLHIVNPTDPTDRAIIELDV